MKVLSLFDGMSCGRIALDRLGIEVDTYYASEIDKYAIAVAKANYPDTIHVGDITQLNPKDFQDIDLILAGSPCQGFSFAGKQLAFDDPRSALFFEFIRLLKAIKPKYFLLENVRMKQQYIDVITQQVSECYPDHEGNDLFDSKIEPILINSALLSAQSRQRLYWTNIPRITQPEDRGIVLRDVLEDEVNSEFYHGEKSIAYMEKGNDKWQQAGKRRADGYEQNADKEKSFTITENWHKGVPYNYFKETKQRVYSDQGKAPTLTASNKEQMIETKPKQVGIASDINGHDILKRVYSPEGKSPTLNTMGGGNREPKVAMNELPEKANVIKANYYKSSRANFENDTSKGSKFSATGVPLTSEIRDDVEERIVVDLERKRLIIAEANEKGYTIIEDGDCFDINYPNSKTRRGRKMKYKCNALTPSAQEYMHFKDLTWRKLTPLECERLQTVPDNYTASVSNTQRYKMLGNGWTVEVICHILKNMEN